MSKGQLPRLYVSKLPRPNESQHPVQSGWYVFDANKGLDYRNAKPYASPYATQRDAEKAMVR